jgi:hypothetical protein
MHTLSCLLLANELDVFNHPKNTIVVFSSPSEQLPAHVRNAEHSHQKLPSPIISQLHAQGEVDPVQKQRGLMARA